MWQHPTADFCVSADAYDSFRTSLISRAEENLREFVETSGGLRPERTVQEGTAADAILCFARERAISLIVLGTHGRRGVDRAMLGSVTERVLRHATCPVLAIRHTDADFSKPDTPEDPVVVRRVLCCVDFSAHSQRALEYALSAAASYDAEVTFLHVLDGEPNSADVGKDSGAAMESLQKLIPPPARASARTHIEVRLGKAYQEILKFASEAQADLIVTGVRGRHSLDLAVFGSTTYRMIQLGAVPVLTVPI
jgi:nucleotide-binding universal stress UspA family protein